MNNATEGFHVDLYHYVNNSSLIEIFICMKNINTRIIKCYIKLWQSTQPSLLLPVCGEKELKFYWGEET